MILEQLLYSVFYTTNNVGQIASSISQILVVILVAIMNLCAFFVCAIIALILFVLTTIWYAGIYINKGVQIGRHVLGNGVRRIFAPILGFGYRHRLSLLIPIVFFIFLYCGVLVFNTVISEEPKNTAARYIKIYDHKNRVLYNGSMTSYRESKYKRGPELVEHVISLVSTDSKYSTKASSIIVFTTFDLDAQERIREDHPNENTTDIELEGNELRAISSFKDFNPRSFTIIKRITDENGNKVYGGFFN